MEVDVTEKAKNFIRFGLLGLIALAALAGGCLYLYQHSQRSFTVSDALVVGNESVITAKGEGKIFTDVDEAKMAYSLALEEYRHAAAVGKEFQIDLRNADVGRPMSVRSPITGKVLSNDLVVGEFIVFAETVELRLDERRLIEVLAFLLVFIDPKVGEHARNLVGHQTAEDSVASILRGCWQQGAIDVFL